MIEITRNAQEYFQRLILQQDDEDLALRISVNHAGTPGAGCDLQFCPRGQSMPDDHELKFDGLQHVRRQGQCAVAGKSPD